MLKLKLEQNKLSCLENNITSSDSLVRLYSDVDAIIIATITMADQSKKIIQFIKPNESSEFLTARLIIDEHDIKRISNSSLFVESINGSLSQKSNVVKISVDIPSVKLDVKQHLSSEFKEILERVIKLEEKYQLLKNSKILENINIVNKSDIKEGMIPVAINEGNFVAMYPFSNHVVTVNGQEAANGAVEIDATMIKYKQGLKSTEQALDDQASAIRSLKNLIDEIVDNQKTIMRKVDDLDFRLSQHINDGII